MPTSVRLDRETEEAIGRIARTAGRSRSWVIREAVAAYAAVPVPRGRTPGEMLRPFIGAGGKGLPDLSDRTGERFTDLVRAKTRARRTR